MLTCPVCDADMDIDEDEVDEGESLCCYECGADLKVLGKTPLELVASADDVEEDEDEIFDDDDEDIEVAIEDDEEEQEIF